jgi:hypothetical protein
MLKGISLNILFAFFVAMFSSSAGIITLDLDASLSSAGNYTKTKTKNPKSEVFTDGSGIATVSKTGKPKKGDTTPESESRAYFVFDLSEVTTEILNASIDFSGSGDILNFEFFQVKSNIEDLRDGVGSGAQFEEFYDDLGKDAKYANGKSTSFDFGAALIDMNNARSLGSSLFAFGVKSKDKKYFIFENVKLTLTTAVPEPGEIFLLLAGVVLVFLFRRKELSLS